MVITSINSSNKKLILSLAFASLAQLVEQLIRNEQVVGSSPMRGSYLIKYLITDIQFQRKFSDALSIH